MMRGLRALAFAGATLLFGLTALASARAQDISAEAGSFISNLGTQAINTITDKSLTDEARTSKFRELFVAGFDVPAIAKFVLGRYWRTASEAEQAEFLKLFEGTVIRTYSNRFKEYNGQTFKVTNSRSEGDNHAIVTTQVLNPDGGAPIRVEWRVLKPAGQLKIVDVIVEGVSMSVTQQQEYGSVIQRSGGQVEGLLAELRKTAQ